MAPTDSLTDQLKDTIQKLQDRVEKLEARLHEKADQTLHGGDGMRMILIGPPGAGKYNNGRSMASELHVCFRDELLIQ